MYDSFGMASTYSNYEDANPGISPISVWRILEMKEMLKRGLRVPVVAELELASYVGGMDMAMTNQYMDHDELTYNHSSRVYESRFQSRKIRELEQQLTVNAMVKESEETKEKIKLEDLIAYYYNR